MHKRIHGRQSTPAIILCSPERAMKHPNHYAGICSNYKPVFPAPALPIHTIARATAAHSTPASPRNKATLFSKMRVEKKRHPSCKRPSRQAGSDLLPGFKIGRDQPNLINAGAAHDVDGPSDFGKAHRVVSLDEGDFLSALLEDVR